MLQGLHISEQLLIAGEILARSSPDSFIDAEGLATRVAGLEAFLHHLSQAPPALITIARSADAFMSILDVPQLEALTFGLLDRIWGRSSMQSAEKSGGEYC